MRRIMIIGGGAAGIMAAIQASRLGAYVTIIERNLEPAKKLLVTGNGRCNFSNAEINIKNYLTQNANDLDQSLHSFDLAQTLSFFKSIGMHYCLEDGRYYPRNKQASTIRDLLLAELAKYDHSLICQATVQDLCKDDHHWRLVIEQDGKQTIYNKIDAVLLAMGGQAGPAEAYRTNLHSLSWFQQLKLPEVFASPALVGLNIDLPQRHIKDLFGTRCPHCQVSINYAGDLLHQEIGEIHWSKEGLSGIPILNASAYFNSQECTKYSLSLDLVPELTNAELKDFLRGFKDLTWDQQENHLTGIIPRSIAKLFLKSIDKLEESKRINYLIKHLKNWTMNVQDTWSYEQAQVTKGGLSLACIEPATMETKHHSGLYLAGEMLDVTGQCGGYNLQWAWTSGALAGIAMATRRISTY